MKTEMEHQRAVGETPTVRGDNLAYFTVARLNTKQKSCGGLNETFRKQSPASVRKTAVILARKGAREN